LAPWLRPATGDCVPKVRRAFSEITNEPVTTVWARKISGFVTQTRAGRVYLSFGNGDAKRPFQPPCSGDIDGLEYSWLNNRVPLLLQFSDHGFKRFLITSTPSGAELLAVNEGGKSLRVSLQERPTVVFGAPADLSLRFRTSTCDKSHLVDQFTERIDEIVVGSSFPRLEQSEIVAGICSSGGH